MEEGEGAKTDELVATGRLEGLEEEEEGTVVAAGAAPSSKKVARLLTDLWPLATAWGVAEGDTLRPRFEAKVSIDICC